MKNLIMVGGTMGVGKTAACTELAELLPNNVLLDGDWCWDLHPFVVTEETKAMAMANIADLLNRFLRCSVIDNVIFCWVLHRQEIVDALCARLELSDCRVHSFSLVCSDTALCSRLRRDIEAGRRTEDVLARSLARQGVYAAVDSEKIDVSDRSARGAAEEIRRRVLNGRPVG